LQALIIGFGSIGKRHFEVLSTFDKIVSIDVVTKQSLEDIQYYIKLEDIEDLTIYDYFIVASETAKHYDQLKYICSKVENKKILAEKPLFDKQYEQIKTTNQVFTAYNLRFHPIISKLKEILQNQTIYYANVICGQYLPTWRPGQDYRVSYSADIKRGGGVLRDLSHELDYIHWLFGSINRIKYIDTKISDLEIGSDDIFTAIAVTTNQTIVSLTIDYISKNPLRRLIIHTKENTIEADIINNSLIVFGKDGAKQIIEIPRVDRNYTYLSMHRSIINNDFSTVCSFQEGKEIVKLIDSIEYKELF